MIDHLLGRPSNDWKRTQVLAVITFWATAIASGNKNGPPIVRWFSRKLRNRLTPWQVIAATLTCLYAIKNADAILGLQAPEPLARLYSRDFYRATWVVTALDAGFATAMHVRPKWLRDILSILFSGYYLLFANHADEKLRKYRAICSVEMLRATWEKTTNPILRAVTFRQRPRLPIKRKLILPRPQGSPYKKPVIAWLYYAGTDEELAFCRQLILEIPGGGFVCMGPAHHDDRLHFWAQRMHKPILAIEYSKAPEYPYPYAMHECFDAYRLLHESKGSVIGMGQGELQVVLTGDSAGANIGAAVMIKLLETPAQTRPPLPLSVIWTYPALDFNFTSFMPPEHLRILRQESQSGMRGIADQKDHLKHQSPLSVVEEPAPRHKRRISWSKSFGKLPLIQSLKSPGSPQNRRTQLPATPSSPGRRSNVLAPSGMVVSSPAPIDDGHEADTDGESDESRDEKEKTISERVQYWNPDRDYAELDADKVETPGPKGPHASTLGTRLTMTSRTGFFNDRIISPSMMRAMAICYVGPRNSPDLSKNYYISPILAPTQLLAHFPPVYMLCGERDPFSDDTLIFAGRIRDAKMARKAELTAKQGMHGEGLRMSTSLQSKRDPILDEVDTDWVTMRFVQGWSHGFMQMATLLPKVRSFFDLTADWAEHSFMKHKAAQFRSPYPAAPVDSTSENEAEVLSFKPKRRGSRTTSPVPAASVRSQLQQHLQPSATSPLSSSASETNCSTAPTSVASLDKVGLQRPRIPSQHDSGVKLGPVQRVLQEEADAVPIKLGRSTSDPARGSRGSDSTGVNTPRRGSDTFEHAFSASTFVETRDLLQRRRQDAVYDLGSAITSDDSDDNSPVTAAPSA